MGSMGWIMIDRNPLTAAGVTLALVYIAFLVVFRLILSPVAAFPGPRLAGLTFWYEFYYDVVLRGRYMWKIKELHGKYGPIIRINPEEIHINDFSFYPKLYTGSSERRDKWLWSMKMFGNTKATFTTIPHGLHRRRRAAINPSFSKAAVTRLEPEICRLVNRLCDRVEEFKETGTPVNLGLAFAALTADVVTQYSFGNSYRCLEAPDFNPLLYRAIQANTQTTPLAKQYGWIIPLSRSMPHWMVQALNPLMMQMVHFAEYIAGEVQAVAKDGVLPNAERNGRQKHATIFQGILDHESDPEEKDFERLMDDGISVVGAGLSTTADTLRITAFHILDNADVLQKLKAELLEAIPEATNSPLLKSLESLPYLSAVVTEGLRISCGISSRLQRVSPELPLAFGNWVIPAGTPVSMSIYLIHYNPDHFPEPDRFWPERWLNTQNLPIEQRPDQYFVPFSRGTRACVGLNLATAELYLTLAYMFRRIDLTLYKTTREDVEIEHDFLTAFPRLDSEGVRVLVR